MIIQVMLLRRVQEREHDQAPRRRTIAWNAAEAGVGCGVRAGSPSRSMW